MTERPDLETLRRSAEPALIYSDSEGWLAGHLTDVIDYALDLERQHAASQAEARREAEHCQMLADERDTAMERDEERDAQLATLTRELATARAALIRIRDLPGADDAGGLTWLAGRIAAGALADGAGEGKDAGQ